MTQLSIHDLRQTTVFLNFMEAREIARQQHRKIALYCIVYCWLKNIDSIRVGSGTPYSLTNISRIEGSRENFLIEDFKEFFQYVEIMRDEKEIFDYPLLSRNERPSKSFEEIDYLKIKDYLDISTSVTKLFGEDWRGGSNANELYMSCYLILLSQGKISPKEIVNFKKIDV